ncbi:MAG: ABC transporter permease, partial [Chloroflexi bacterium]|nr:ABC transporter permease [Chloroflexota bacterium]
MDSWRAFPAILLALVLIAALGPDIENVMLAIGIVSIPSFARLTRGQTLSIRENEYIIAARAMGASPARIVSRHILPNVIAPVIAYTIVMLAYAILTEAGLSFLGLGVPPPTPSWGGMVRAGYPYLGTAPWYSLVPGMAIFVTVLGAQLFGNGVRDALDPTRRSR